MYFDHAIQRQRIDHRARIKTMIDGIAVKVVQIEQEITTAFLGEQTEGVWILHIPGDKSLGIPTMGDAILSIWGTDPATLNTLLPRGRNP